MKKSLFRHALPAFVIGLFLILNQSINAQYALDGFDPNPNGEIHAIVVQPDGKIIIGGGFTTVSPNGSAPVERRCIARFNPDGTLDTAFNAGFISYAIYSIVVQPDGKIVVGGGFTSVGGQPRSNIARLDAITGQPDSFNPNSSNAILQLALQSDGKILAVGYFSSIGGQPRQYIARLDPTTGLADSFNPNPEYYIYAIAVQPDGKIVVGGRFAGVGGQGRSCLARLDPVTGLADSFNPNVSTGYFSESYVTTIAIQADGKVLAGGYFERVGGLPRRYIARLDAITGQPDSFNPTAHAVVSEIAVQPDGKILVGTTFVGYAAGVWRAYFVRLDKDTGLPDSLNATADSPYFPETSLNAIALHPDGRILVGGEFRKVTPNGGTQAARQNIARFERDGSVERYEFNVLAGSGIDGAVTAIAVQPDGKILVGGGFSYVGYAQRYNIARLNLDGTVDSDFNPDLFGGAVNTIAIQPDGKILVGGNFSYIGGQVRTGIARLDPATGLADSFNPGANGNVYSIAIQPDGKILVGGTFTNIGGQARNFIARLDQTTGLADSFDSNANNQVSTIVIQPDRKILVSGDFTNIGGQARHRFARLDQVTGAADSFDPNVNGNVNSIAVQTDGKILAGGNFQSIGGQARNHLARLDQMTGAADSFNPNANGSVSTIAIQSDGKILVSGFFNGTNSIGGQSRNYIARLDATNGAADSFNPNANSVVHAIAIQQDGRILVTGGFTSIGGQGRYRIARLINNTAALSSLSVSRTTVTLTRDGSAAKFTHVVFELSTDNGASWTSLGTAAGSFAPALGTNETGENQFAPLAPETAGYTLTGLNLPTGQNILVRAGGLFSSGFRNGSQSIEDKVQIAFLPAPTAAQVSVSGRVLNADGSGLRNAQVILIDASGNSRTATTGSFGYFRFDDVQAGETYVFSVVVKGYQFAPQAVTVNEELSELNFTAQQ
jgi:uncharacterized delta-60 repeat protein